MKVSDLQPGDIIWLYNSKEDYFAEFVVSLHQSYAKTTINITLTPNINHEVQQNPHSSVSPVFHTVWHCADD